MRQTRTSPRRCHRSCLARTCHCRTTSSWHRRGAAATSHAPHGPSGCRRDAMKRAHVARATSTKCPIIMLAAGERPASLRKDPSHRAAPPNLNVPFQGPASAISRRRQALRLPGTTLLYHTSTTRISSPVLRFVSFLDKTETGNSNSFRCSARPST